MPHEGDLGWGDPITREVDGVAVGLVHGGHAPPRKRAFQRITSALAFKHSDELFLVLLEAAQDGIGEFAVHFDMTFAGKGVGIGGPGRAAVAEEAAEDVGEEIGEQGGFLEAIGAAGSDEVSPVPEFGLPGRRLFGQAEGPYLLTEDFRVEERFGFDSHVPRKRVGMGRGKPRGFGKVQET